MRTKDIPQVTVTSDRTVNPNSVTTSKKADAQLMQATGTLQISDVLKYFSGATVKDYGGVGGLKTVSVRGLGASHTAVAYDGIIITDNQTGQIDLGKFSASQTESVRMVSGPDNDLLQPASLAAQAAVISLNTGRPDLEDGHSKSSAQLKYGSFNTLSAQAESAFKAGQRNTVSLQGEWLKTDGDYPYTQSNGASSVEMRRDNSDVRRLRLEGALFSDVGRYYTLTTRAYWFQSEQGLPANILYNANAARERLWNRNGFLQSTLTFNLDNRGIIRFGAKYGLTDTRYLDPKVSNTQGKTDNRYREQEGLISIVIYYHLYEHLSFSVGTDARYSALDGNGAQQASPTRYTVNSSIALKYASERITLTARLNQVATTEKTRLRQAAESYRHNSPTAGLNWLVWPSAGLHIRASYSNTFRLPTFNDLYFEQIGRRDLRPEQASVTSAGIVIENETGGISYSVYADAYNSDVKDRIMAVPGKNTAVWMMKNIGLVTTHGVETGLELRASKGPVRPALQVSYTYQRSMDKTDSNSTTWNHQLPYTPRHSASAVTWIETPYVNASLNLIYSGEYFCNGYNGPEYLMPSYYELGCSLWRTFDFRSFDLSLKAECINLTDSRYELVRNYPMPGRQFRLSATFEL
jgi:outer membrane cobalamin receptor